MWSIESKRRQNFFIVFGAESKGLFCRSSYEPEAGLRPRPSSMTPDSMPSGFDPTEETGFPK